MGLLDRIKDFFQGGVKKEAIERLYNAITSADEAHATNAATKQLARFDALKDLAKDEHIGKFRVDMAHAPDADTWSYSLSIDGTPVAEKTNIAVGDGHDLVAFQDAKLLGGAAAALVEHGHPEGLALIQNLRENFASLNDAQSTIDAFAADASAKFTLLVDTLLEKLDGDKPFMAIDIREREAYDLVIGQNPILSGPLPGQGQDERSQFVDVVLAGIHVGKQTALDTYKDAISLDSFIEANVQCMTDDVDQQKHCSPGWTTRPSARRHSAA